MPRYLIISGIKQVHGHETRAVEAENGLAALRKHREGKSELIEQEIEVMSFYEPEVIMDEEEEE